MQWSCIAWKFNDISPRRSSNVFCLCHWIWVYFLPVLTERERCPFKPSDIGRISLVSSSESIRTTKWRPMPRLRFCLHRLGKHWGFVVHICHANAHRCSPCPRRIPSVYGNDHKLIHVVGSLKVQSLAGIDDTLRRDGKFCTLNEIDDLGIGAGVTVCCKDWSREHLERKKP